MCKNRKKPMKQKTPGAKNKTTPKATTALLIETTNSKKKHKKTPGHNTVSQTMYDCIHLSL